MQRPTGVTARIEKQEMSELHRRAYKLYSPEGHLGSHFTLQF